VLQLWLIVADCVASQAERKVTAQTSYGVVLEVLFMVALLIVVGVTGAIIDL
jgi:hypothetical protein